MDTVRINSRLTNEEKETVISFDYATRTWLMDTTISKYYNKALRQGWTQLKQYVYTDGSVCGGVFQAPDYAITIRSTSKKQLTDAQMNNLFGTEDD